VLEVLVRVALDRISVVLSFAGVALCQIGVAESRCES